MSEKDKFAAYRIAGEFFGRLEKALGFGDLSMHAESMVFVFSWGFTAKGKRYGSQLRVDSREILIDRAIHEQAERIAARWKDDHRKVTV